MIATGSDDDSVKLIDIGTEKTVFSSKRAKATKQKGSLISLIVSIITY